MSADDESPWFSGERRCPVSSWISSSGPERQCLVTPVAGIWRGRYSRSITVRFPSKPWLSVVQRGRTSFGFGAAAGVTCVRVGWSSPLKLGAGSVYALFWRKGGSSRNRVDFSVALVADLVRVADGLATSGLQDCTNTSKSMEPIFAVASRHPLSHNSTRQRCGRRLVDLWFEDGSRYLAWANR